MQDTTAGGAKKDTLTYALPPVMTIDMVEAVAAEMKQLPLPEKTHLILDASQLEAITTPGFEISLITPDTRAPVAGNASWSAEGY